MLRAIKQQPEWSNNYNLLGIIEEHKKRYQAALECYLKAVYYNHYDPDSFMNIALLFSKLGEEGKARDFYEKAFSLKKPSAALYYNYGVYCEKNGRLKEAVANYIKSLKINPAYIQALNNLGVIFFETRQFKIAAGFFEKTLLLDPRNVNRMVNLAYAYIETGDLKKAENIISKALKIKPGLPSAEKLKLLIESKKRKKDITQRKRHCRK
jgi:tetratricopeptide (TPR) repeat protein